MSNPGAPSSASAVAADAAAAAATAPSHLVAAPSGYGNRPRVLDKVCIVTGATGGIGAATVLRFAEEGARGIVISDLSQSACEAYAASLSVNIPPAIGASGKVEYIALAADVTDEKQVAALFDQALQKWGHVDVVFANAGLGAAMVPIVEERVEVMEKMLKVNTVGTWLTAKHAARAIAASKSPNDAESNNKIKKDEGSIIINSSVGALYGAPALSPYGASKWASRGLGLALAKELGPQGIRVNNLHPGGTITPLFHEYFDAEVAELIRKSTALKRLADPIEIANAVLFLASDESSYVSGATLGVHAGQVP